MPLILRGSESTLRIGRNLPLNLKDAGLHESCGFYRGNTFDFRSIYCEACCLIGIRKKGLTKSYVSPAELFNHVLWRISAELSSFSQKLFTLFTIRRSFCCRKFARCKNEHFCFLWKKKTPLSKWNLPSLFSHGNSEHFYPYWSYSKAEYFFVSHFLGFSLSSRRHVTKKPIHAGS